jgi:hypothetical protein
MHSMRKTALMVAVCVAAILASVSLATPSLASSSSGPQSQPAAQNPAAKQVVGVIKDISGNTITLAPDAGAEVSVVVKAPARILRVAPGQTDLKNATPLQLADLQVGDRILVRGELSSDAKSLAASSIIAMKRSDVEAKQAQESEDWQKRGIGGLVSAADPAAGTITISVVALGGTKTAAIHTSKETILRRYAPGSVKFDDARPSTLDQVKPGDQLRARGTRSADGSEFAAEEIVSGSFRNVSGTITSIDVASSTLTAMDLIAKKPVLVRITSQSQIRKLPPEVAQGIAVRLKGAGNGSPAGGPPGASGAGAGRAGARPESARQGGSSGGMGGNPRPGSGSAQADFQQIVSRMPPATLADLQKGDVVMIVSTEGANSGDLTAIMLVGGVAPILTASPSGGQPVTLSPWSLDASAGEAAAAGP